MGPMAKGHDVTYYKTWYRSSRGEVQVCSERRPIRNLTFQDLHLHHSGHQANTSQDLAQRYGLESVSDHHGNFSITMRNLTSMDSGLYCCLVVEIRHHHSEQRVYGAMELQVHTGEGPLYGTARGCGDSVRCGYLSARVSDEDTVALGVRCCVSDAVTMCDARWVRLSLQGCV